MHLLSRSCKSAEVDIGEVEEACAEIDSVNKAKAASKFKLHPRQRSLQCRVACLAGAAAAPAAKTLPSARASPLPHASLRLLELWIMSAAMLARLQSLQRSFGRPCASDAEAMQLVFDAQQYHTAALRPGDEPQAAAAILR